MIPIGFNSRALKSFVLRAILSIFIFAAGNLSALDPAALFLTWQRSPDTTMTIRWITPLDQKSLNEIDLIRYSKEGSGIWEEKNGTHALLPENAPYMLHSVELTNLQSSSIYLIKVGSDGKGRTFKFKTMPSTLDPHIEKDPSIKFVVGGDIYHDTIENFSKINTLAAKTCPDFALLGGDIAYAAPKKARLVPSWAKSLFNPLTKQYFDRWLTWLIAWTNEMITPDGRSIPLIPVIGNHDCNGSFNVTPDEAPFFYALFPMPGIQGFNALDFGNYMSLFLLDTSHTHPIEGKQTEWLEKALQERKDISAKFALYHVPAYPSARPFNYKYSALIRKFWTPLFDQYGLTAAFENHDHDYKRTFPLISGKKVDQGVLYFGDGAWGVGDPRKPLQSKDMGYLAKALGTSYFLHFKLDAKEKKATAINSKGETIDQYTW